MALATTSLLQPEHPGGLEPVLSAAPLRSSRSSPACGSPPTGRVSDSRAEPLESPRPEHVHIILGPDGAGAVAFGGQLTAGPPRHRARSGAKWEVAFGYCRALRVGDLTWVTGSAPVDDEGQPVGKGDAYRQAQRCLEVIDRAVSHLGGSRKDIVRTRIFVTHIERDCAPIGTAHQEFFDGDVPTTTMVEVQRLIEDWMLVEIEADACFGQA